MVRKLLPLISFFLVICLGSNTFAEFKKTKIAVLDFELRGDSFTTKGMGGIVAEWFTTALVQDGRFEVVERALLKKIIEEQKLGMTGLIDEKSTTEIGKILGVKTIITGSVLQIQKSIEVNARIINVRTGSIIAAENIRSTGSENLKEVIERLTGRIVKNFPLTGYIVKKNKGSVLIDLGADQGLQAGMEFLVFKEGEVIKHPKTGEVLEVEKIATGKIQITDIRSTIATGTILQEEKGRSIAYGQMVQSIPQKSQVPAVGQQTPPPKKRATKLPAKTSSEKQHEVVGEQDNLSSGGLAPVTVPLPTGTFMMGSKRYAEKPQHFVNIKYPVRIMATEVTFDDFEKFCLESDYPFPDDSGWGKKNRPVINVSWEDAKAYAAWLTEQTGILYRLPTESEWEWANGGGSGNTYFWGHRFKKGLANCKSCSNDWPKKTLPVASFPANSFKIFDTTGNVWEWVEDCWSESYRNAPEDQTVRTYSGKCGNYTIRGGGWNSSKRQITITTRMGIWAQTRSNYIGFRLVRDEQKVLEGPIAAKTVEKGKKKTPSTSSTSSNDSSSDFGWDSSGNSDK